MKKVFKRETCDISNFALKQVLQRHFRHFIWRLYSAKLHLFGKWLQVITKENLFYFIKQVQNV